jgi:hypothetical protein
MTNSARALNLTIDANSGQDMVMLLKQALYEIEQMLPLPHDASAEEKLAATMRELSSATDYGRVTGGHSESSIGGYAFEFIHSSRAYHALEQSLLNEGYVKTQTKWPSDPDYYTHETLPAKCIDGTPLSICDAPAEIVSPSFF